MKKPHIIEEFSSEEFRFKRFFETDKKGFLTWAKFEHFNGEFYRISKEETINGKTKYFVNVYEVEK